MKKNKLTVLFDANPMVSGPKTGVGHYTYQLIDAAASDHHEIKFIGHYFNFLGRKNPDLPRYPNIKYKQSKILPGKTLSILRRFGMQLPFELLVKSRGDVALFPNFVSLPCLLNIKKVVVVHDLSYVLHPQYVSPKNRAWLTKFVPLSLKSTTKAIAVSANTKKELVEYYKLNKDLVSVITPAVDHDKFNPRPKREIDTLKQKFSIPGPYILSVGTIEPRKNLIGVLKAFERLPDKTKQTYSLVLAGGKGWLDNEIQAKFNELSAKYSIIKTGYVNDEDLPGLYSGASVFVFPSFYEGFGIPPLEAMACGTPVIVADNSSLPEVVDQAGIKIKANNTKMLASKIEQVLTEPKLGATLARKGIQQAKKFSWNKSATRLIGLFEEI